MKPNHPKPNSFLWPLLQLSYMEAVENGFDRLYTGNTEYEGEAVWGNYLYALFSTDLLSTDFQEKLTEHPKYKTHYHPDETNVMFIFDIDPYVKENIVTPFLDGRYSEMEKYYIKGNFSQFKSNGSPSLNWRILHKDPLLKQYWEELINCTLPEKAEVWARPEKEEDIYKYKENDKNVCTEV